MSFARMFRIYYKNVPPGDCESERSELPHTIVKTSVYEILSNFSFEQTKDYLLEHGRSPSYWTDDEKSANCNEAVKLMERIAIKNLLKYDDFDSHSETFFLKPINR
jgi:hypothetical protein